MEIRAVGSAGRWLYVGSSVSLKLYTLTREDTNKRPKISLITERRAVEIIGSNNISLRVFRKLSMQGILRGEPRLASRAIGCLDVTANIK